MPVYDVNEALAGVRSAGCLQSCIRSFAEHLISRGYVLLATRDYLRAAAHLGRWMDGHRLPPESLGEAVLSQFARHRCRCPGACGGGRSVSRRYTARARRFAEHLRAQGMARHRATSTPTIPALLARFREWMLRHRGLATLTIARYLYLINRMLPALGENATAYDAALIRRVFLAETKGMSRVYARTFVSALRTFLRFLAVDGGCPHLERAVPTIPQWRLSALPKYIQPSEVERVIGSCDLSTPHGIRDRAVLLLLARLGLRAGDIVGMTFDDLDWKTGTIRVRAKGRRDVRLPLAQEVGDAILQYVSRARPSTPVRHVFLCANAPVRPFQTLATVSDIVRLALKRAGIINPPSRGAHLLRHSAATAMLRGGASLETIATVLRHQSTDTTALYAKVDVDLLGTVAQPWPEVRPC